MTEFQTAILLLLIVTAHGFTWNCDDMDVARKHARATLVMHCLLKGNVLCNQYMRNEGEGKKETLFDWFVQHSCNYGERDDKTKDRFCCTRDDDGWSRFY